MVQPHGNDPCSEDFQSPAMTSLAQAALIKYSLAQNITLKNRPL
jgi:hypothetical protein